ncbi:hypothetical protein LBMAG24_07040 [Bacteroidota bacterium]|nr:hypothetical protein LBMAG24_07040 [Bacteroidota bacterium]
MKKVVSISFLIVFLLANTELHEVLKVPLLFEHYLLHKQEDKNQSFVTFIYKHYVSVQDHFHLQNDHDGLPLKTKDCIKYNPGIVSFLLIPYARLQEAPYQLKQRIFFKKVFLSNLNQGNIWQPPQIS